MYVMRTIKQLKAYMETPEHRLIVRVSGITEVNLDCSSLAIVGFWPALAIEPTLKPQHTHTPFSIKRAEMPNF